MVRGSGRRAKKRSTTETKLEPQTKSPKVNLLNPTKLLLLDIPSETNTSLPVWTAIKSQQVSAVWTVNPQSINISLTPALCSQDEALSEPAQVDNQSLIHPQGSGTNRPCVLVQMVPQSNSEDTVGVNKVQPLQSMAPVSSFVAKLPGVITRAQPTAPETSKTSETWQTQPPEVQSSTPVSQRPLHFHTRNVPDVEICDDFLIRTCPRGGECLMHHTKFPFHWQLRSVSSAQWIDVPLHAQFALEKRYCHVNLAQIYIKEGEEVYDLDFDSMQLRNNSRYDGIRRLVNSDKLGSNFVFPAEWAIYWWDDHKWTPYNKRTSAVVLKTMKQKEAEECFFHILLRQYKVNFQTMVQTNVLTGFKRNVRCRPHYRNINTMMPYLKTIAQEDHSSGLPGANFSVDALMDFTSWYPPVWCLDPEQDYSVVDVPEDSRAYWSILTPFFETLSETSVDIISVQQVQNWFQWDKYQRQKVFMMKKYPWSEPPLEKHLFHGTNNDAIEAICQDNFDPRLAGEENGAAYGLGTYFAVKASLSDKFASKSTSDKVQHEFLAKVLVGASTVGLSGYRRPPVRKCDPKQHELYDSCVDNWKNPASYVVFDSCQCYPYSLIKYRYVTNTVKL